MTIFEEKIKKGEKVGFLVFACGECGDEVLVPLYSKIPSIICDCRKPMLVGDEFMLDKIEIKKYE